MFSSVKSRAFKDHVLSFHKLAFELGEYCLILLTGLVQQAKEAKSVVGLVPHRVDQCAGPGILLRPVRPWSDQYFS